MFNTLLGSSSVPWWSDLGNTSAIIGPTDQWSDQYSRYERYARYYFGTVFDEKMSNPEAVNDGAQTLVQPVGMNLTKMLCVALADALYGEWTDRPYDLAFDPIDPDVEVPEEDRARLRRFFFQTFDANQMTEKSWELGLDQNRYGGSALRIRFDLSRQGFIHYERFDPTTFYPIWNPDDMTELLEVYVALRIPATAAKALYGYESTNGWVLRVEHWTKFEYTTILNGQKLDKFCGKNPYGLVPFVYVPRLRSTGFYGESVVEDIWRISDEINMRVADIGESLNYNTHPIKYGYNLPADFSPLKYPLSPSMVWNLGRVIGSQEVPELKLLESKHPVPVEAFRHVSFLYDWARNASSAPPITFGEDDGGQRSGSTLVIRMWPLIRSTMRSRAYNATGINRMLQIAMKILEFHKPTGFNLKNLETFKKCQTAVLWSEILPRARVELIDEMVKRMSTPMPLVSLQTALSEMGDIRDIAPEVERIRDDMEEVSALMIKQDGQMKANKEAVVKSGSSDGPISKSAEL